MKPKKREFAGRCNAYQVARIEREWKRVFDSLGTGSDDLFTWTNGRGELEPARDPRKLMMAEAEAYLARLVHMPDHQPKELSEDEFLRRFDRF